MTKDFLNQTERNNFIVTFLDEVKFDILNNKQTIIANMDKVELTHFIAEMVDNCKFHK